MNKLLKTEIIEAYNKSNKNKENFLCIVKRNTGLTNKGLNSGTVKIMIDTLIFK